MQTIHIISFGKNQTPRTQWWWKRSRASYTIQCEKHLPKYEGSHQSVTGTTAAVVYFYEHNYPTISFLADTYTNLLTWVRSHKHHDLYIYVKSETGTMRSVYVGNKCAWFLSSLGYTTEVLHMELSRKNLA